MMNLKQTEANLAGCVKGREELDEPLITATLTVSLLDNKKTEINVMVTGMATLSHPLLGTHMAFGTKSWQICLANMPTFLANPIRGCKHWPGHGNAGGFGMAGTGKRADHKKQKAEIIAKKAGAKSYFGKQGGIGGH
jgi:hypothetical protein